MNAGLGLGLPSTFTTTAARTSGRSFSTKTIVPPAEQNSDFLFPLPTFKNRSVSTETYRVRDLQSYWSPDTEVDVEAFEAEDEIVESPAPAFELVEEENGILSPLQLAAHACLHLLSPKGDALGRAAAMRGLSAEDALTSALEFAWLVPMVDTSSAQIKSLEAVKEPEPIEAPAMRSMPSIASITSSISMESSASFSDFSSPPSEHDAMTMARSHSIFSSFSTCSLSTAATSTASILDRKRPIASYRSASSQVIKLQGPRTRSSRAAVAQKQQTLQKRASVRSQCASVELCTPTSEDMEVMMQPMEKLPSPAVSATADLSLLASSPESGCSNASRRLDRDDTRATLFEIWSAAEEAERARRASPVSTEASPATDPSRRVSKWVKKQVRKSTSTASLLRRMDEDASEPFVEPDVLAWAEGKERAFEALKEGKTIRRVDSIQQILAQQQEEKVHRPSMQSKNEALWAFLG